MKRLRMTRGKSVVRRRGVVLVAVAAGLVALAAFAAVPALASHDAGGGGSGASAQGGGADNPVGASVQGGGADNPVGASAQGVDPDDLLGASAQGVDTDEPVGASAPDVNFRKNALFTCFGANGGTATNNTATISASLTTITAVVTVHAAPGTSVNGQLDQSRCAKLKFFSFTIPDSGSKTVTITDTRISNDAFVWFNDTAGDFQITPEVVF